MTDKEEYFRIKKRLNSLGSEATVLGFLSVGGFLFFVIGIFYMIFFSFELWVLGLAIILFFVGLISSLFLGKTLRKINKAREELKNFDIVKK